MSNIKRYTHQGIEAVADEFGSMRAQQVVDTTDMNETDGDMAVLGAVIVAEQTPLNRTRDKGRKVIVVLSQAIGRVKSDRCPADAAQQHPRALGLSSPGNRQQSRSR